MIGNLKSPQKNEMGFTLIEVMVVIVMIGILAAIAVPIYTGYVYRARASEGVAALGAIKTYMLERRSATGYWPTLVDLNREFHNFSELYYFETTIRTDPDLSTNATNSDTHLALKLIPSDEFDLPTNITTNRHLQLDIDWNGTKDNIGWSGGVWENYAKHLPKCQNPKKFL